MKTLAAVLFTTLFAVSAHAEVKTQLLQLGQFGKYLSTPQFSQALAEASSKINGWKSRVTYSLDNTSRTTVEIIHVTLVGKKSDQNGTIFQQADFEIHGLDSGWQIIAGPITIKPISESDFASFN